MEDAAIRFASAANEIKLNSMAMEFVPRKGDDLIDKMIFLIGINSITCINNLPILNM